MENMRQGNAEEKEECREKGREGGKKRKRTEKKRRAAGQGSRRTEQGSYTVEAALLCPILCLLVYGAVLQTVRLYGTIADYAQECSLFAGEELRSPDRLRLLAAAGNLYEAVSGEKSGE